jgi:Tfp pilus assembly protein PilN
VNLLPRSLQERRLRRLRVGQWALVVTAGLFALGLVTVLADRYLASAERELEARRAAIAELEPNVRRVGELQGQARAIGRHLNPDFDALEVYTELHRIVPAGVSLYHVQFQFERGRLSLKGQTTGFPAVWKLLEALSASPLFTEVETRYAARREVRGNQVIDFSIDAGLRGGRS